MLQKRYKVISKYFTTPILARKNCLLRIFFGFFLVNKSLKMLDFNRNHLYINCLQKV